MISRHDERKTTRVSELYQHVRRYALHSALAELGVVGMKIFRKDPSISHLLPSTLSEWQLAFIAKSLILNSNDHRREAFGDKGLFACVNIYNDLYDKLLDVSDDLDADKKSQAMHMFLIRLSNQQFPFQMRVGHYVPRALFLFDEIPTTLENPAINIHEEIKKLYGLTPKQILIVGFAVFAASDKGYFNPDYLLNTQSADLRKHLTQEAVQNLVKSLTADYNKLRELFRADEGEEGMEQYAFNALRTFPIVQTQIAGLVIPVPRFVLERITNGIFYSLMDRFNTGTTNPFLEFFGKELFERYIGLLLEQHYASGMLIKEFEYGGKKHKVKSSDWIVIEGEDAILIECKTSGITKEAKSWGDVEKVQDDLRKRVIHSIIQLYNFERNIKAGVAANNQLSKIKNFHYVVVTYDRIFMSGSTIKRYIDAELSKEGLSNIKYQILGVDEVEKLIPVLKNISFTELVTKKEANSEWATWDFDVFMAEYVKTKGVSVGDNELLEEKFESLMHDVSPDLKLKKREHL